MGGFVCEIAVESWVDQDVYDYSELNKLDLKYVFLVSEKAMHYSQGQLKTNFRNIIRINKNSDFSFVNPLEITYNPENEKCIFHYFKIYRNGSLLDAYSSLDFSQIQREKGLEQSLYTGIISSVAHVNNLQIGDIVDYSYTIASFSRVYKNHFTALYATSFSIPLWKMKISLNYSSQNQICKIREVNSKFEEKNTTINSGCEYKMEWMDVNPIEYEEHIPLEDLPRSYVEFSDYKNWEDFGNDLLLDYSSPEIKDFDVSLYLDSIGSRLDEKLFIEKVINHVKSKMAYQSISIDEHSYLPHKPSEIVKNNYGDCKDKSYLLKILLNDLGVRCNVVLVHTFERQLIADRLISLVNFNHALVHFFYDGVEYQVDLTDSITMFSFERPVEVNYGVYLNASSFELVKNFNCKNNKYTRRVVENFTIIDDDAVLEVRDFYQDHAYFEMRKYALENDFFQISKNYLGYYNERYKEIAIDELHQSQVIVDESKCSIEFRMYFKLMNIWNNDAVAKREVVSFEPVHFKKYIMYLPSAVRNYSHKWPHEVDFKCDFNINYRLDVDPDYLTESLNCSLFDYEMNTSYCNELLSCEIKYKSKSDKIAISDYDYLRSMVNKLNDQNGIDVYKRKKGYDFEFKWYYGILGVILLQALFKLFK